MPKGKVIIDGAKAFCSCSQANNSKGTAVPFHVKSQKKNLGKDKYFAQDKPIATNLDNTPESFNNGQGFVMCKDPKNTSTGYSPCKAKCKIEFKDFYENVDFNKSMKVLLDVSTGSCKGYGVPGTIQFADSGQKGNVSQIDVKEADVFSVSNASPQWETSTVSKKNGVTDIQFVKPVVGKPEGTYYFIKEVQNALSIPELTNTEIILKANYTGDASKISWGLYKGEGIKDKIKTFVGIGDLVKFNLNSHFADLEQGKYRIEAYVKKAGDPKCHVIIEYVKDQIKGITAPGKSLVKNVAIPITIEYKVNTFADQAKVLNQSMFTRTTAPPIVSWRIKQGGRVIYNSFNFKDSSLVKVLIAKNYVSTIPLALITFENAGEYTIEAYTDPSQTPHSLTLKVVDAYGVNTIKHNGKALLRYNDLLEVSVGNYNVDYIPTGQKKAQWYLQKNGEWLRGFTASPVSKGASIKKQIDSLLYNDAQAGNNYFGKYLLEAYGSPLAPGKSPSFKGSDTFAFEVIENAADKITLPLSIPTGAKVKYETAPRIAPLVGDEKLEIEVPEGVTQNSDGTLTFTENGSFTISTFMTGRYTRNTKASVTVKVGTPEVRRALWSYSTGQKRTETGYKEETFGFVEIIGLENQSLKAKIWIRGEDETFYNQPEKFLLEEKTLALDEKGKGSFKIITNDDYKKKIEAAVPKTAAVPQPKYNLVFTIEVPKTSGAITQPDAMLIQHATHLDNKNLYTVLEPQEELSLVSEQKIKSIVFSTEDGKEVQRQITHYDKKHKIRVHTVNMVDEELKIDVFKEVPAESMTVTEGIMYTHESKKTYPAQKVGSDSVVELDFTPDEKWANPPQNIDHFMAQVAKKVKDASDPKKESYVLLKNQLVLNTSFPARLVQDATMEKIGVEAKKADGSAFTKDEMLVLCNKFINYDHGVLKVAQNKKTVEAVKNNDVFVEVDTIEDIEVAEVRKGVCECESYHLYYGSKVSCKFRMKVIEISKSLWPNNYKEMANGLMAVMYRETSKTFATNIIEGKYESYKIAKDKMTKEMFYKKSSTGSRTSRAVGLIQFTQNSLISMKEFISAGDGSKFDELDTLKLSYARMSEVDQLEKVKKYMNSVKSLPKVPEDIYVAVFAPFYVGENKDTVMYKKGTNDYDSNPGLDKDDNGIQIKELLGKFKESFAGGLAYSRYKCKNSELDLADDCPDDKCIHYADVVDDPRINDQSNNVNKNRYIRVMRINKKHPKGYYHTGVDILASLNTPLKSLLCGTVTEAYDTGGDLGKIVTIKSIDSDDKDVWIRYCHLNSLSVKKDDKIKHGEEMGKSGNTGNAIDINVEHYHVHIEASIDGVFKEGHRVDPEQYMKTKFDETTEGNPIK